MKTYVRKIKLKKTKYCFSSRENKNLEKKVK